MEDGPESRGNLFYKDKIILYSNVFKKVQKFMAMSGFCAFL